MRNGRTVMENLSKKIHLYRLFYRKGVMQDFLELCYDEQVCRLPLGPQPFALFSVT